jgi:hypothetical protein
VGGWAGGATGGMRSIGAAGPGGGVTNGLSGGNGGGRDGSLGIIRG